MEALSWILYAIIGLLALPLVAGVVGIGLLILTIIFLMPVIIVAAVLVIIYTVKHAKKKKAEKVNEPTAESESDTEKDVSLKETDK